MPSEYKRSDPFRLNFAVVDFKIKGLDLTAFNFFCNNIVTKLKLRHGPRRIRQSDSDTLYEGGDYSQFVLSLTTK